MNTLKTVVDGAIMMVTIDRPERLNAINSELLAELDELVEQLSGREDIRAVLLSGSGDRAFASGADINEFDSLSGSSGRDFARRGQEILRRWESMPIPTIAVIDGWALGGGCELALACTLRLASTRSRLGLPEITLGVMPGYGGTQRLTRLVGGGHAMQMIVTGDPIDADRALRIGLVNDVYEASDLPTQARALADRLASRPPISVRLAMDSVRMASQGGSGEAGFALEAAYAGLLTSTADKREGVRAFQEKRSPKWTGQ